MAIYPGAAIDEGRGVMCWNQRAIAYLLCLICCIGGARAADRSAELFYDAFEAMKANNFQEAVDKFREGLALDPDNANANYYLGEAYHAVGAPQRARRQWQRALELAPQSDWASKAKERLASASAGQGTNPLSLSPREAKSTTTQTVGHSVSNLETWYRVLHETFVSVDTTRRVLKSSLFDAEVERDICTMIAGEFRRESIISAESQTRVHWVTLHYPVCFGKRNGESFTECQFLFKGYMYSEPIEKNSEGTWVAYVDAPESYQAYLNTLLKAETAKEKYSRFMDAIEKLRSSLCD